MIRSRAIDNEIRGAKRSLARLEKFLEYGGPNPVIRNELLVLIERAIRLRNAVQFECEELLEPIDDSPEESTNGDANET